MKQLSVDCGVEEFSINGDQVLRFNPADPNLYHRFLMLEQQLSAMEQSLEQAQLQQGSAQTLLQALEEMDRQLKQLLTQTFGEKNDFDRLLHGVNLLATAGNGRPVVINLLDALEPILTDGMERFAQAKTQQAVEQARRRRGEIQ